MQVRMKVTMSGTRNGQDWPPRGELVDLPEAEADDMVRAGLAEMPDEADESEAPQVEEATAPKAETSTPSRRKPQSK
ncbi:hypothetical protein ACOKM5_23400 [Streptomyces sp. BH097]|uniref:hypothetical protein n=1 Tax=unclassified Streptomyces TaxID=2593676 RepID=UPI003BB6967B